MRNHVRASRNARGPFLLRVIDFVKKRFPGGGPVFASGGTGFRDVTVFYVTRISAI